MHGIFIDISDIKEIHGCSYTTARRRIQTIKDSLEKKENQEVTIREFCEFEGISFDEFFQTVKPEPGNQQFKY